MTARVDSDEAWAAQVQSFGREDSDRDDDAVCDGDVDVAELMSEQGDEEAPGPVDLDACADGAAARRQRFDHKVAWNFGGLVAAGLVATLAASVAFYSHDSRLGPSSEGAVSEPQAVAAAKPPPPISAGATPGVDRPLPYSADAKGSCGRGSTPAQTMSGHDPRNAFVCVRGGADGQTIEIDLGRTYVITAISITPGWVGKDASGVSQWSQHRVVTLVQYMFDRDPTSLVTFDTKNVHGEAVKPIKRQLASTVQILIRQTSRPPAEAPQPSSPAAAPGGGGLGNIFGDAAPSVAPASPVLSVPLAGQSQPGDTNSDPVDASFAISSLKIIGHDPG